MARRLLCLAVSAVFVIALVPGAAAGAPSPPKVAGSSIAVDADAYYKGLSGTVAKLKIKADTALAADELAAAVKSDASALGVGDVQPLYADGFREFTLMALGGNCEIWLANDLSYPAGDPRPTPVVTQEQIDYLFAEFNNNIYPGMNTYFGMTADRDGTDGLFSAMGYDWYETDNPQRVMILIYNIIDEGYFDPDYPFFVAGYFWPEMNDVYADRNIIHIDSHDWENRVGPDVAKAHDYEQTFTHEYEHAIHYDHDPGEPSWVDEGLADLAPYIIGYGHSDSHLAYYMIYHRTPLTVWGGGLEDYGASYLFQLYLMENYGGAPFVKALVNEPLDGIEGIEHQLDLFGYPSEFDDVYRDWTVANYIDDSSLTGVSGGKLGYDGLDIPSDDTLGYSIQWSIKNYYGSDNKGKLPLPRYWGGYKSTTVQYPIGTVQPYGPMYLTYGGIQPQLVSDFRGDAASGVSPYAGDWELWGSRGDLLETQAGTGPITLGANASLSFWTNYQIEEAWDFGFVQVSTDGGFTWMSLANEDTTSDYDPSAIGTVIANVPGFTGSSGGWVQETFDLSAYEGADVLLRFLYITDWSYNEAGFYVDEITVTDDTGTLFYDGLEADASAWGLDGFERTTGLAENDWALTFLNPKYETGKFAGYEFTDKAPVLSGDYQVDSTWLDTSTLNKDAVTLIMSNHQPEAVSSSAGYRLLVSKDKRLK